MKNLLILILLFSMIEIALAIELEGRGVWVWPNTFGSDPVTGPQNLEAFLDYIHSLNFNMIFLVVKSHKAYYPSQIAPIHPGWDQWDIIETSVELAHQRNIEVHAWIVVFPESNGLLDEHPEYSSINRKGEADCGFACPARQEVRGYETSIAVEIASNYDVDGIHLDYIRYCDRTYCYCDYCRQTYYNEYGVDPLNLEENDPDWVAWRNQQVTIQVYEIHNAVKAVKPNCYISAAVFNYPDYVNDYWNIYQDWTYWLNNNYMEFVCPMNYEDTLERFIRRTESAVEVIPEGKYCYVGIGLWEIYNNPDLVLAQINWARDLGADGVVFFRDEFITADIAEILRDVFATPAIPPHSYNPPLYSLSHFGLLFLIISISIFLFSRKLTN